jgi:hypothetical protein
MNSDGWNWQIYHKFTRKNILVGGLIHIGIMKKNRVYCNECEHFIKPIFSDNLFEKPLTSAKCSLGKRVMFRKPKSSMSYNFGWIRLCNDFKERMR